MQVFIDGAYFPNFIMQYGLPQGNAGIHHSKYWMPVCYDTIEDEQSKTSHLLFSNYSFGFTLPSKLQTLGTLEFLILPWSVVFVVAF